jgi:hypothetical protein
MRWWFFFHSSSANWSSTEVKSPLQAGHSSPYADTEIRLSS